MALYMTPREVAERWRCSPRQVRRLCADGDLRAMRLGIENWRIAVADVEAYEAARTTAPAPKRQTMRPAAAPTPPVVLDGFTLPEGYEPRFPELWGLAAPTKKAALPR